MPTSRPPQAELDAAAADLQRFEALLQANAGSRKQRDDAATRRQVAAARVAAARQRARAAHEAVARLRAGSRAEEIAAARARVAAADAQLASLEKNLADAQVKSPVGGVVTSKLVDAGEIDCAADAAGRHLRPRSRMGERLRGRAARAAAASSGRR